MNRREFLKSIFIFTAGSWIAKNGILRPAEARMNLAVVGGGVGTPSIGTGNVLHESFESTGTPGYDDPDWSETVGSGSLVDEKNTDVARPTGGGNQILKIQKVSANFNALTRNDMGGTKAVTYLSSHIRIAAEGLGNNQGVYLHQAISAGYAGVPWILQLFQGGDGTLMFVFQPYNNGSTGWYVYPASGSIDLSRWYLMNIKYDDTNHLIEWKVDGVQFAAAAITGTHYTGPQYLDCGDDQNGYTVTAYFDLVRIGSASYPLP